MNAKPWVTLMSWPWLAMMGCGKSEAAVSPGPPTTAASPAPPARPPTGPSACSHATCADHFFVDVITPNDCVAGAPCRVSLKLVATGDFHINDEYPYRFRAEETKEVAFAGTDGAGKTVFSKAAGDWTKGDVKSGSMAVTFVPSDKGSKTISGIFKLSVCSKENCLLEQPQIGATVLAH